MKVVQILSVRSTERVKKTVSESRHLIFVTIRTALVSGNSKLNFYDLDMMNITIQHKIYCHVFDPRILSEKEKLSSSIHSYPIRFHPYTQRIQCNHAEATFARQYIATITILWPHKSTSTIREHNL
jgi:hypothetical protein